MDTVSGGTEAGGTEPGGPPRGGPRAEHIQGPGRCCCGRQGRGVGETDGAEETNTG